MTIFVRERLFRIECGDSSLRDDTESKEAWLKPRGMVYGTCVNYTVYVTLGVTRMIHGCVTPRV